MRKFAQNVRWIGKYVASNCSFDVEDGKNVLTIPQGKFETCVEIDIRELEKDDKGDIYYLGRPIDSYIVGWC